MTPSTSGVFGNELYGHFWQYSAVLPTSQRWYFDKVMSVDDFRTLLLAFGGKYL